MTPNTSHLSRFLATNEPPGQYHNNADPPYPYVNLMEIDLHAQPATTFVESEKPPQSAESHVPYQCSSIPEIEGTLWLPMLSSQNEHFDFPELVHSSGSRSAAATSESAFGSPPPTGSPAAAPDTIPHSYESLFSITRTTRSPSSTFPSTQF